MYVSVGINLHDLGSAFTAALWGEGSMFPAAVGLLSSETVLHHNRNPGKNTNTHLFICLY